MKGGESKLTTIQLMNLGKAFVDLLKADSTKTVQIMNLLKKVSQEESGLSKREWDELMLVLGKKI